ncbi:MAG: hypothetical protein ACRDL8_21215, partial [Solirubrobacteraceae bacterium]
MEYVGYSGIAFTRTRRAVLFVTDGRRITVAAAQPERLLEDRAQADDLPPIPVVPLPENLALDEEPGLPIEEGEPRQLPSSVITEPLVLWATSGSSLSCERLIPYKDGFEIELLAKGAALQAVGESPARRSSRGFERWRGLQPTVRFSDGRRQRIEDLTEGDREAPVIV